MNRAHGPIRPSDPPPGAVRVAGIVLKWLWLDKERNLQRGETLIREAAAGGARVVATSECFLDGYLGNNATLPLALYWDLTESVPDGPYCRRLAALARELGIVLVAGMTERDGAQAYNSAVYFGPDGRHIGTYRKEMLCPEDAVRNTAGTTPSTYDTPFGRIGTRICYDRTFPEAVKATCDTGADFVLLVAGGTYGTGNTSVVQARARENGKYMVFVHPVQFLVVAPGGEVAADIRFGGLDDWQEDVKIRFPLMNTAAAIHHMVIGEEQIGSDVDVNGVGYFDVPLRWRGPHVNAINEPSHEIPVRGEYEFGLRMFQSDLCACIDGLLEGGELDT